MTLFEFFALAGIAIFVIRVLFAAPPPAPPPTRWLRAYYHTPELRPTANDFRKKQRGGYVNNPHVAMPSSAEYAETEPFGPPPKSVEVPDEPPLDFSLDALLRSFRIT